MWPNSLIRPNERLVFRVFFVILRRFLIQIITPKRKNMKKLLTILVLMLTIASMQAQATFNRVAEPEPQELTLLVAPMQQQAIFTPTQNDRPSRAPMPGAIVFSHGFENTSGNTLTPDWIIDGNSVGDWRTEWGGVNSGRPPRPIAIDLFSHSGDRFAFILTPSWFLDDPEAPANNNWLISSEFPLEAGITYTVSFWAVLRADAPHEQNHVHLKLHVGQGNTIDAMLAGEEIWRRTDVHTGGVNSWTLFTAEFTPATTGNYNLGFHKFTPGGRWAMIQLDDITVAMPDIIRENDLAITAPTNVLTQIPISQLFPISAGVRNIGTQPQTNIVLSATHNGNEAGSSTTLPVLAPEATAIMEIPAISPTMGANEVVIRVDQAEIDEDDADNTTTLSFQGTVSTLALDNGSNAGPVLVGMGPNSCTGNIFPISAETELNQIVWYTQNGGTGSTGASSYRVSLFRMNEEGTALAGSAIFTTDPLPRPNVPNSEGWLIAPVPPTMLQVGQYFACIHQIGAENIRILSDGDGSKDGRILIGGMLLSVNDNFQGAPPGALALRMLVDIPDNDLEIIATSPFIIPQIPVSQAMSMPFPSTHGAGAINIGMAEQRNISFSAVFNEENLGTSNVIDLLPAQNAVLGMIIEQTAVTHFPTAKGTHNLVYTLTQQATENLNPSGLHTITFPFVVGDVYAFDAIDFSDRVTSTAPLPTFAGLGIGNIFTIHNATTITGVQVGFATNPTLENQEFTVGLYRMRPDGEREAAPLFLSGRQFRGPGGLVNIDVPATPLPPGDYLLVAFQVGNFSLGIATDPRDISKRAVTTWISSVDVTEHNFGATAIRMVINDDIPVLTSISPNRNDVGVQINTNVVLTFNKDITANNLDLIEFAPPVAGVQASISNNILTITHDGFEIETLYTVTIPVGVIEGYDEVITWSFTTVGATANQVLDPNVVVFYPNPVDDVLHIQTNETERRIEIYNLQGTFVMAIEGATQVVDVSRLPAGVYIIKFITGNGISTQRFVKR